MYSTTNGSRRFSPYFLKLRILECLFSEILDHQIQMPTYVRTTKRVAEYKEFLLGADINAVPAKETLPTCDEIKGERR
jgi:hypothetical protein